PPSSTLFPYTTLFRSAVTAIIFGLYHVKTTPNLRNAYGAAAILGFHITLLFAASVRGRVVGRGNIRVGLGQRTYAEIARGGRHGDRKSTRLNSSHLGI